MDVSFNLLRRAVLQDPKQAEAWANLAFIAFKRGDCATAAQFAGASAEVAAQSDSESRSLFDMMTILAARPADCAARAAALHPYPGL
jgi:cytochrome c-type biogenesis protein CcmH/NrfG